MQAFVDFLLLAVIGAVSALCLIVMPYEIGHHEGRGWGVIFGIIMWVLTALTLRDSYKEEKEREGGE